ncbi:MAG TPA: DEAD/DEAH box helicase [Candidatus Limnocylindrales bacterium]|nr:DEAD/DEAH box helicase [Candidatus Limnocylindrales bacterium]
MSFADLGLAPELLRAVEAEGYTEPTPVQAQAIPHVLARRDVLAGAQTGTGKTAAFVLPILQLLNASRPTPRHPIGPRPKGATGLPIRCLVLTPTRELALQVEEFVRTYGKEKPIRSTTVYGGVGYDAQIKAVQGGPEIVVATPGRLLDIAEQGKIDLRSVEILVLDEADRMLDMGFIRDIRKILALLPARRQNLLFSATFADDVRQLASTLLNDPALIQVARRNAAIETVRQVIFPVDKNRKRELLVHLIREGRIEQALVFVRTKHGAQRLADQLVRDGISAAAIHGDRTQGQRVRALDDFKEGRVAFLVATEVAARGLDIDGLPHVVNFELPTVPEDYIHRIGRTGRAGLEGDAVSLVCLEELELLNDIEALLRRQIRDEVVPGFALDRRAREEAERPVRSRSTSARSHGGGRDGGQRRDGGYGGYGRDGGSGRSGGPRRGSSRSSAPVRSHRSAAPQPHRSGSSQSGTLHAMPGESFARNRTDA